jgi:hypothetical protein
MNQSRGYQHQPPRRPRRLARRLVPPPERPRPDLTPFLYVGFALAALVVLLAVPYIIATVIELIVA